MDRGEIQYTVDRERYRWRQMVLEGDKCIYYIHCVDLFNNRRESRMKNCVVDLTSHMYYKSIKIIDPYAFITETQKHHSTTNT